MINAVPHVALAQPYSLAKLKVPFGKELISLSQNESLRAPSPKAIEAAAAATKAAHLYPDPEWQEIREVLSSLHQLTADSILCGSGSMELIACLTHAFCDERGAVLAPAHAYPFFRTATTLARGRFDTAPEDSLTASVDALLDAVRPNTRIVFIANPGNPTGTVLPRAELLRLREGLREDILLVIDEAYGEFVDHLGQPVFHLVAHGDTVVLRTFSKAYGLAGMRVGWGLFPDAVAAEVRKVMNPNNISVASQAAAAAALADQDYMRETCMISARLRDNFIGRLRNAKFETTDSFTNFALLRFEESQVADLAEAALAAEGIIARPQGGAGLPNCLRVTVGSPAQMDLTAQLLERWRAGGM